MGRLSPTQPDIALVQPQTVSAVAVAFYPFPNPVQGLYNVAITGTFSATVQLERSFDGGGTWAPLSGSTIGTTIQFTAPTTFVLNETERGVLYRVNCTVWASGTVNVRISG